MKVLTQAQLNAWLDDLAREARVVAPVDVNGKLLYRAVSGNGDEPPSSRVAWGFERTAMSPKTWLFPATEPILTIEQGESVSLRETPEPAPTVVFGVRPCDARGALAIDALFLDKDHLCCPS